MISPIKRFVRPVVCPVYHGWQWFHDYSRGKLREFRDHRRILNDGTTILKDVQGVRFVLYPWDRPHLWELAGRVYDQAEFQAIPRLVKPGDIAFDVGANVGVYSVLFSRLCGPAGRVWAFEPVHDTYWRLRETLALNRCDNVSPMESAVCDKDGIVQMNLFEPQNSEWNSLGMPSMSGRRGKRILPSRSVDVTALTLDQFCNTARIDRVNFLKVDVEGFELSVFRGAERMLREQRVDYICFEISQEPLKGAGVQSRQVFEALEVHGYVTYRFDRVTKRFQGPIRDTSEAWTNFFASRTDLSNANGTVDSKRSGKHMQEDELVRDPK